MASFSAISRFREISENGPFLAKIAYFCAENGPKRPKIHVSGTGPLEALFA
jgi:hypothetical protein